MIFVNCKNFFKPILQKVAIVKKYSIFYNDCILADIRRSHKAEVTDMILDEYDEKFHIACEKKLSYEQGRADERELTNIERQRAENAILMQKIVILHSKHQPDNVIAQKLNIPVDTVQKALQEIYSDTLIGNCETRDARSQS